MVAQLVGFPMGEGDDVGLDASGVDTCLRPALGNSTGQSPRPLMVVGKTLDHRRQGDQSGGREDTRLTHSTAEPLAFTARRFHHVGRPGQHRSDRR